MFEQEKIVPTCPTIYDGGIRFPMCGIAGFYLHPSGSSFRHASLEKLNAMTTMLSHRGPDHLGAWCDEKVFMGQARLKVLDLSQAANQPLFNEDKTIVLLVNGEIYNFQELRKKLQTKGHVFYSQGDSEVIVHLYEEYGLDFLSYLEGMFALALYDKNKNHIILARDRTGKKPLYYINSNRYFAFASEIKAFFALDASYMNPDEALFPYYFVYGSVPAPQTLYKNIFSLEPGHYLIYDFEKQESSKHRYWDISQFYKDKKNISEREAAENIQILLKEAVKKRLISDVPLGTFLSGGLDSTLVTALARQELSSLKTFSIGYDGDQDFDETRYAKIASTHFKTDHTEFHIKPFHIPEMLESLVFAYDGPFGDCSCIPTSLIARLTKQHVTVALTGDGGDEVFGGYNRFLISLWMEKVPGTFWKYGEKLLNKPFFEHSENKKIKSIKRALLARNLSLIDKLKCWTSFFYFDAPKILNSDFLNAHPLDLSLSSHPFQEDLKGMTPLSQMLYFNLKTYLHDDLNVKVDRASMAYALETRSPFLDHHLIEYCAGLPDHFFLRGLQKKYILKKSFEKLLPREILNRKKAGFGLPLGKWFRRELKDYVMDELGDLGTASTTINKKYVKHLLAEHMSGVADHYLKLWNVLMFKKWLLTSSVPHFGG